MRIVTPDKQTMLRSSSLQVECGDPLQTLELIIPIGHLVFRKPGWYSWEVLADGRRIGSARLRVVDIGERSR